jgi:hypothetical protein
MTEETKETLAIVSTPVFSQINMECEANEFANFEEGEEEKLEIVQKNPEDPEDDDDDKHLD